MNGNCDVGKQIQMEGEKGRKRDKGERKTRSTEEWKTRPREAGR